MFESAKHYNKANPQYCKHCGYEGRMRKNQQYCSRACKQAAYRTRKEKEKNHAGNNAKTATIPGSRW